MKMRHRRARFVRRTRVISFRLPTWIIDAIEARAKLERHKSAQDVITEIFLKVSRERLKMAEASIGRV